MSEWDRQSEMSAKIFPAFRRFQYFRLLPVYMRGLWLYCFWIRKYFHLPDIFVHNLIAQLIETDSVRERLKIEWLLISVESLVKDIKAHQSFQMEKECLLGNGKLSQSACCRSLCWWWWKRCTFEQDCIVNMVLTFPSENLCPSTVQIDMAQLSGEYLVIMTIRKTMYSS